MLRKVRKAYDGNLEMWYELRGLWNEITKWTKYNYKIKWGIDKIRCGKGIWNENIIMDSINIKEVSEKLRRVMEYMVS
jgi:hypothetical protein